MRVRLKKGCKLYFIDSDTLEQGIADPLEVSVHFEGSRPIYTDLKGRNRIIVQAFNRKKAASKILWILKHEKNRVHRRNKGDS